MKKITAVILIFALVVLITPLTAKERRGAKLIIQKRDGRLVKGELIAVKQNPTSLEKSILLLKEDLLGADVSVEVGATLAQVKLH